MTSDEEDVIIISESRVADAGPQCSSKEQNASEREDSGEKNGVLTTATRQAYKKALKYMRKKAKKIASREGTCKRTCSSGSNVNSLNQSRSDGKHICIMCGEPLETFADLKVHLIQAHSYPKENLCSVCGELFSDLKQLEIHKQEHTEAEGTSYGYLDSALPDESNRHDDDVTKDNMVESEQGKPQVKKVDAEWINGENECCVENVSNSAENWTPVYKSKVENITCPDTKTKFSIPLDKFYICKICKKFVVKSYAKVHEKMHSLKGACKKPPSSMKCKTSGSLQEHHLMNKNEGNLAKAMTLDKCVLNHTYPENETRSTGYNFSDEKSTKALPLGIAVRHANNMEINSNLLHDRTFEAVSVNLSNLKESSSVTERSEKMPLISVATENAPPVEQKEAGNTTSLKNINSDEIVTSTYGDISAKSSTQTVLLAIPAHRTINLPIFFMSLGTNVLASTDQMGCVSHPTVLPMTISQSNAAFSMHDGSQHKPPTSEVTFLNRNAAPSLTMVSGTSAPTSSVPLRSETLFSASQVSNESCLSFIHLPSSSGKVTTVPEANLSIGTASHTALCNGNISSQAEALVKANTEVPYSSSSEIEKVDKSSKLPKSLKSVTKTKIYSCPICKKGLSKKYVRLHMMRVHLGERPFHCEMCDKSFCKKSSLTKHIAVKHAVETGVTNSGKRVLLSGSNDLTVKGSGVNNDFSSQSRINEQNEHDTANAMVLSMQTNNQLESKADCKISVGGHETSHYMQGTLGCTKSGERASEFYEPMDAGIRMVNSILCENDDSEEVKSSCGKMSSLHDANGLSGKVYDDEHIIESSDIEIMEEFQVLSVESQNNNVGEKRKLYDASLTSPKQKFNQSSLGASKLRQDQIKRICTLCNITFYEKCLHRIHMYRKHSKFVSSKAQVQCHQCGKLFLYASSLKQHLILKHRKN